jgi:CD63 antigen
LQFVAVIVGFTLRSKGDGQLRRRLFESMSAYKSNNQDVVTEWDRIQKRWSCCGVNNWTDWTEKGQLATPPNSCCLNNNCESSGNVTAYFDMGCYESARTLFSRYSKALGGVSLFFLFVELAGLALAILLLRDLKSNYATV